MTLTRCPITRQNQIKTTTSHHRNGSLFPSKIFWLSVPPVVSGRTWLFWKCGRLHVILYKNLGLGLRKVSELRLGKKELGISFWLKVRLYLLLWKLDINFFYQFLVRWFMFYILSLWSLNNYQLVFVEGFESERNCERCRICRIITELYKFLGLCWDRESVRLKGVYGMH